MGGWVADEPMRVEVRLVREHDNAAPRGCDLRTAEVLSCHGWRAEMRMPIGGPYRLESRLAAESNGFRYTGDKIWHIFAGDLWVAAGQSNAVGYGHGLVVDPPAGHRRDQDRLECERCLGTDPGFLTSRIRLADSESSF